MLWHEPLTRGSLTITARLWIADPNETADEESLREKACAESGSHGQSLHRCARMLLNAVQRRLRCQDPARLNRVWPSGDACSEPRAPYSDGGGGAWQCG